MLNVKRCQARTALCLWIGMVTIVVGPSKLSGQTGPPPTERQEVTETFFGQSVTDAYRWLENWQARGPRATY
jgi:hypothetical protein